VAPFGWLGSLAISVLGVAVLAATLGYAGDAERFLRPLWLLGAVWPLGAAAVLLFDKVLPVGPVDDYGSHSVARLAPFVVCALCSAGALALVGARLRRERPADLGDVPMAPVGHATA
jgi:hypothetical protein